MFFVQFVHGRFSYDATCEFSFIYILMGVNRQFVNLCNLFFTCIICDGMLKIVNKSSATLELRVSN